MMKYYILIISSDLSVTNSNFISLIWTFINQIIQYYTPLIFLSNKDSSIAMLFKSLEYVIFSYSYLSL